jgi:hypothetical protein
LTNAACRVATTVDRQLRPVRVGEHLRGDDPAYRAAPQYFSLAGAPHAERPKVIEFTGRWPDHRRPAPAAVRLTARLAQPARLGRRVRSWLM